jgi:hypothetical protein
MRPDSIWVFDLADGFTPFNPLPDLLTLTISQDGKTCMLQPKDAATWEEQSVYIEIQSPEVPSV